MNGLAVILILIKYWIVQDLVQWKRLSMEARRYASSLQP
jgi:hypothetical protein